MNREKAKELLPIMQAFVDGKRIEYSCDGEDWIETEKPTWDTDFVYRIKPEPKHRPFKSQEECWQEMHKHPDFGWLKSKGTGSVGLIGTLYEKDKALMIIWATNEKISFSASDVFNDYVFTDCTPFGIKEE